MGGATPIPISILPDVSRLGTLTGITRKPKSRLAKPDGPRIISQEKTQRLSGQHLAISGRDLVRPRVYGRIVIASRILTATLPRRMNFGSRHLRRFCQQAVDLGLKGGKRLRAHQ